MKERVVFRTENTKSAFAADYIAVFPDDEANPGMLAYVAFKLDRGGRPVFEPYAEMSRGYYYGRTKLVKKNSDDAEICLKAIMEYYPEGNFRVMEKL